MQNRKKNSINNHSMTSCNKGGIKIKESSNNKMVDPFDGVNPFNVVTEQQSKPITHNKSSYENLELNIDNYSREELFKLFGILSTNLTQDIMKECKKIVLKSHPDKSRLEPKYFLFFTKAYKRLLGIYEFQNNIWVVFIVVTCDRYR